MDNELVAVPANKSSKKGAAIVLPNKERKKRALQKSAKNVKVIEQEEVASSSDNKYLFEAAQKTAKRLKFTTTRKPPAKLAKAKPTKVAKNKLGGITISVKNLKFVVAEADKIRDQLKNYQPSHPLDSLDEDLDNIDKDLGPILLLLVAHSMPKEYLVWKLTNFTIPEFCTLWTGVSHIIQNKLKVGLGCNSTIHPMDSMVLLHTQLKSRTLFSITCHIFSIDMEIFRQSFESLARKLLEDMCGKFAHH